MLEDHDEDHEHQTLLGADQQDQECRRHRTQEGPEEGDHVGHAHHHADQRRVGHFQDGTADKAQDADDEGVQQLAADKAGEDGVHPPRAAHDRVGIFLRQRGVDRLAAASQALFLHAHQIDGHDDAHDQVKGKAHRAADAAPDTVGQRHNGLLGPGQHLVGQKGHAVGIALGDESGQPDTDPTVALQQVVGPAIDLAVVGLGVVDEGGHAVHHLGHQHAHQQIQQEDDHGLGQQDAHQPQRA